MQRVARVCQRQLSYWSLVTIAMFESNLYHIISYIIRTNVLEHTRHTSALTVAQKHNETFQRNSTELKS